MEERTCDLKLTYDNRSMWLNGANIYKNIIAVQKGGVRVLLLYVQKGGVHMQ